MCLVDSQADVLAMPHTSAVLRIDHRALEATIRKASRDGAGLSSPVGARVGIVTFIQRFGASLDPHVHATAWPPMACSPGRSGR